jgi:hypothetical protein
MKKLLIISTFFFVFISFCSYSQIKVDINGQVGIANTAPAYKLDISGSFRSVRGYYDVIFLSGDLYSSSSASIGKLNSRWYELFVEYPTFTYSPDIDSDISYKSDINNVSDMLGKVKTLRPVTYKLAANNNRGGKPDPNIPDKNNYGFIAQEMTEIFPDIVTTRIDGTHGIRYTELIPILVKAIQEQQLQIEELQKKVEDLESKK